MVNPGKGKRLGSVMALIFIGRFRTLRNHPFLIATPNDFYESYSAI
jgi:hypothetical protein